MQIRPIVLFVGTALISTAVIIWLVWATWNSAQFAERSTERSVKFQRIAGDITHFDEVLTMSALMAASTGSLAWEKRYMAYVPRLDTAIAQAIEVAGKVPAAIGAIQTKEANSKLIKMEEQAFDLVRKGRLDKALALLRSKSYEIEKNRYAEGNKRYIELLRIELANSLMAGRNRINISLYGAFAALVIVVGLWFLVARYLRTQQLRVEAANIAKSEFLAITSHELRTPLTSLKGSLSLIVEGGFVSLPQNVSDMLSIAQRNTERLISLVNDILDVEKIESGSLEYNFEPLNLSKLVTDVVETSKEYAEQYDVTFILADVAPEAKVYGDGGRLAQVIANLLSNAAKFSPQGGEVKISVDCGNDIAKAAVIDNGPGIPESMRDQIFDKFTQVDSSDTRSKGGTGLGLNISESIVKSHGGEIGFESEPGMGSKFFFTLPVLQ